MAADKKPTNESNKSKDQTSKATSSASTSKDASGKDTPAKSESTTKKPNATEVEDLVKKNKNTTNLQIKLF
jgi:hypothetical protein